MSDLYKRIEELCREKNETITTMCKASGASRASLSDLKVGRKQSLSAETLSKIAAHFGVSVDYLLGATSSEWSARFRTQLAICLENANEDDLQATGADVNWLRSVADGNSEISFDRACEIADTLGVSIDSLLGKENKKAPTNGERDILDEVDVAFYGDFKELNDDEKETVRDMVRLMRQRKEKRSQ